MSRWWPLRDTWLEEEAEEKGSPGEEEHEGGAITAACEVLTRIRCANLFLKHDAQTPCFWSWYGWILHACPGSDPPMICIFSVMIRPNFEFGFNWLLVIIFLAFLYGRVISLYIYIYRIGYGERRWFGLVDDLAHTRAHVFISFPRRFIVLNIGPFHNYVCFANNNSKNPTRNYRMHSSEENIHVEVLFEYFFISSKKYYCDIKN